MNQSDNADRNQAVPATALLFQAPEFLPPAPTASKKDFGGNADDRDFAPPPNEGSRNGSGGTTSKRSQDSEGRSRQRRKKTEDKEAAAGQEASTSGSTSGSETTDEATGGATRRRRRRGGNSEPKGGSSRATAGETGDTNPTDATGENSDQASGNAAGVAADNGSESEGSGTRRRRRRTRATRSAANSSSASTPASETEPQDQIQSLKGSTRLEAKRMRRREGRREGRRRHSITEAEFLARRESVDRQMVVRHRDGLDQIAVLEDGILVEHYVARKTQQSIVGNIYLGRVHNVLPSMEAAFVDIGRGRNAVLYAGEVNWDALGMEGKPRRIETALSAGDTVLVQVTKDTIGHKGARLTSQITLAGRYLVLVPGSSMLGISRKLPDTERTRLKKLLRESLPKDAGVIVRTAAEGASEEQLLADIDRLTKQWDDILAKQKSTRKAPALLRGEPELVVRVARDVFNEDFSKLIVQGDETWQTVSQYVQELSPELADRLEHWTAKEDVFHEKRIDQQLAKGMDRKVWLPSGGTLIIDRTEAMTVIDVNTGKFIGSGGTLEETVTRNNLEAAEEIVRQLRLRDIGGMIIIDFVDMVLESNRELVLRRLVECLGRDRTRHQVTEVTSLGLVQMTRKRVGEGLVEAFSTPCEHCEGRGFIVHDHPVELGDNASGSGSHKGQRKNHGAQNDEGDARDSERSNSRGDSARGDNSHSNEGRRSGGRGRSASKPTSHVGEEKVKTALSAIAAATVKDSTGEGGGNRAAAKVNEAAGAEAESDSTGSEAADKRRRTAKSGTAKSGGRSSRRVVSTSAVSPETVVTPEAADSVAEGDSSSPDADSAGASADGPTGTDQPKSRQPRTRQSGTGRAARTSRPKVEIELPQVRPEVGNDEPVMSLDDIRVEPHADDEALRAAPKPKRRRRVVAAVSQPGTKAEGDN